MTTLVLLRHAKAIRHDPGGDHARPLAEAGRAAAIAAGERLRPMLPPDVLVAASDARRTRETAELAFPAHAPRRLQLEASLYGAEPGTFLGFVRALPTDVAAAVVVGHNPGISEFAAMLAATGRPDDLARVRDGLGTADAVVLDLADGWAGAGPKTGRIVSLLARKDPED